MPLWVAIRKNSCSQLLSPSGKINLTVLSVANLDSQILQNSFEWGHVGTRVITEGLNDNFFSIGYCLIMPGVRLDRHLA